MHWVQRAHGMALDPNRDPPMIGENYRVLEVIGHGGFGTVYLCEDKSESLVAVKLLHRHHIQNSGVRERFVTEAQRVRRVESNFTVNILAVYADATDLWMAMDYVDGPNLFDARRSANFDDSLILSIAAQTARGLADIHGAGIIHRDLNSKNILLADTETGPELKIVDFGISRDVSDESGGSTLFGTPGFMSAEHYDRQVTEKSDVYTWGLVVCHVASGRSPTKDWTPSELRERSPELPPLPPPLKETVQQTLRMDPKDRPTSEEVATRLAELTAIDVQYPSELRHPRRQVGERPTDPDKTQQARSPSWITPGRVVASLAVAAFLLFLSLLFFPEGGTDNSTVSPFAASSSGGGGDEPPSSIPPETGETPDPSGTTSFNLLTSTDQTSTASNAPTTVPEAMTTTQAPATTAGTTTTQAPATTTTTQPPATTTSTTTTTTSTTTTVAVSVPGQPTGLSASATANQVLLSWSAPGNNGGAAISDYVVEYSTNAGVTWTTFADGTSMAASAIVSGLSTGTTYTFRVTAVNSAGTGSTSTWVSEPVGLPTINVVDAANGNLWWPSIAISPTSGNPGISYRHSDGAKFAACDNRTCTSASLAVFDDSAGATGGTSLVYRNQGTPVVAYYGLNDTGLKVATCTSVCTHPQATYWIDQQSSGLYPSIGLKSDGTPFIAHMYGSGGQIRMANCLQPDCSWFSNGNNNNGIAGVGFAGSGQSASGWVSTANTSSGLPLLVFRQSYYNKLRLTNCESIYGYSTPDGCMWGVVDLVSDITYNPYPSIAINNDDWPVIAYYDAGNGDLKVVACSNSGCHPGIGSSDYVAGNSFTIQTVDSSGNVGTNSSIAIQSNNNPVIAYYDVTNGMLKVAECTTSTCSNATIKTIGSADNSGRMSIAIGSDGVPIVAYIDGNDLKVAVVPVG